MSCRRPPGVHELRHLASLTHTLLDRGWGLQEALSTAWDQVLLPHHLLLTWHHIQVQIGSSARCMLQQLRTAESSCHLACECICCIIAASFCESTPQARPIWCMFQHLHVWHSAGVYQVRELTRAEECGTKGVAASLHIPSVSQQPGRI